MGERHLVLLLTALRFAHILDFVIMMPLGPVLMRTFGLDAPHFGLLVSSHTFAACAGGLAGGFLLDRFGRRAALLTLHLGFTGAALICALAPDPWTLAVGRAVAGLCDGLLGATVFAIVADAVPKERRGRALGLVMAAFSFASIVGIPLGLVLADRFGWRAPFAALSGLCALLALWAWTVLPPLKDHLARPRLAPVAVLRAVFAPPAHRRAFLAMVPLMFAGFTVIPFISPSLSANVGFSDLQLALIYLFGGLASVGVSPWVGRLADRHGARGVFVVTALLSLAPTLLLTHLGAVGVPLALVVTTAFVVTGSARFVPAMTLVTSAVAPPARAAFLSFNTAVQSASMALATLLGGAFLSTAGGRLEGYGTVGWISCGFVALGVVLALGVRPWAEPAPTAPA